MRITGRIAGATGRERFAFPVPDLAIVKNLPGAAHCLAVLDCQCADCVTVLDCFISSFYFPFVLNVTLNCQKRNSSTSAA
jgi:hypothetical protein